MRGINLITFNRLKKNLRCKVYGNFIVFRIPNTTVCTLFSTGHVNATGIKKLALIDRAAEAIRVELNKSLLPRDSHTSAGLFMGDKGITVDNISATGFFQPIKDNFVKIISQLHLISKVHNKVLKVNYNNQKFPGLFIKTKLAMVIAYKSGKFVIVGCGNTESLKKTAVVISHIFLSPSHGITQTHEK